ncbi:MAG: DNA polymerase III subunit epsilon [Gammaproteobacteria bacterium]
MRQVVLDTETTGLSPMDGHRIIEIGCVEVIDRKLTNSHFHQYICPRREIDSGAVEVHGITTEFLADKPFFEDIRDDFIRYIDGAELIIHNAPFDVGFINHELGLTQAGYCVDDKCSVMDTLIMARKMHPGQKNSLDALCRRYEVNNSHRELHGALLDAEILADVYLLMTGGQVALSLDDASAVEVTQMSDKDIDRITYKGPLNIIRASDIELAEHEKRLVAIRKACGNKVVWDSLKKGAL